MKLKPAVDSPSIRKSRKRAKLGQIASATKTEQAIAAIWWNSGLAIHSVSFNAGKLAIRNGVTAQWIAHATEAKIPSRSFHWPMEPNPIVSQKGLSNYDWGWISGCDHMFQPHDNASPDSPSLF